MKYFCLECITKYGLFHGSVATNSFYMFACVTVHKLKKKCFIHNRFVRVWVTPMPFSHLQRRDYCDLLKGIDGYRCKLMTLMKSPVKLYKAQKYCAASPRSKQSGGVPKNRGKLGDGFATHKNKRRRERERKASNGFYAVPGVIHVSGSLESPNCIIYSPLMPKSLL